MGSKVSDFWAKISIVSYIRFFGGDPTKVTIGGESAGAIAVSALTLTRKADGKFRREKGCSFLGLFRAAVMESGSTFIPSMMSYSEATRNSSM